MAKEKLRYKAALDSLLFELLLGKFTMPQLQSLYEAVFDIEIDKGNFNRKLLSINLLLKLQDEDKLNSKKGAFYYRVHANKLDERFKMFLNFVPNQNSNK